MVCPGEYHPQTKRAIMTIQAGMVQISTYEGHWQIKIIRPKVQTFSYDDLTYPNPVIPSSSMHITILPRSISAALIGDSPDFWSDKVNLPMVLDPCIGEICLKLHSALQTKLLNKFSNGTFNVLLFCPHV